jgi:hypothetical protein
MSRMRDLILEQLRIIRRNVGAEHVEEFISAHIDFADMARLNPGTITAHGYLEGAADAVDMTVLEMLDNLDIDPSDLGYEPPALPAPRARRRFGEGSHRRMR